MSEECPGNCLEGGILGVKGSGKYVWGENVEGEFGGHEMSEEMSVQEKTVQSKKLGELFQEDVLEISEGIVRGKA